MCSLDFASQLLIWKLHSPYWFALSDRYRPIDVMEINDKKKTLLTLKARQRETTVMYVGFPVERWCGPVHTLVCRLAAASTQVGWVGNVTAMGQVCDDISLLKVLPHGLMYMSTDSHKNGLGWYDIYRVFLSGDIQADSSSYISPLGPLWQNAIDGGA